jgi:hypothetical protein
MVVEKSNQTSLTKIDDGYEWRNLLGISKTSHKYITPSFILSFIHQHCFKNKFKYQH